MICAAEAGPPSVFVGAPVERADRGLDELGARALVGHEGIVGERVDDLGMPVQCETEHPRRAEDATRPFGGDGRLAETACERGRACVSLRKPAQLQQAEVGVGRDRQPSENRRQQLLHDAGAARQSCRQLLQRGARLRDVAEPECTQALLRGRLRKRADAGECVEQRCEEQLLVDRSHDPLVALLVGVEPVQRGRARFVAVAEHACEVRACMLRVSDPARNWARRG